jgi:hypothetical protein
MAIQGVQMLGTLQAFKKVSRHSTLAIVEVCTLLCESHQNPEVISNYLRTDISKIGVMPYIGRSWPIFSTDFFFKFLTGSHCMSTVWCHVMNLTVTVISSCNFGKGPP